LLKGVFVMGHKKGNKNKASLPKAPIISDGIDEEFSRELADEDDMEAQARANAADQRVKSNHKR
jgi:hypothetical protein